MSSGEKTIAQLTDANASAWDDYYVTDQAGSPRSTGKIKLGQMLSFTTPVDLAVGPLTDLGSVTSPFINLTGSASVPGPTITSFGTAANCLRQVMVSAPCIIADSSAIVCPNGIDKDAAVGDYFEVFSNSDGSIWTIRSYFSATGTTWPGANTITDTMLVYTNTTYNGVVDGVTPYSGASVALGKKYVATDGNYPNGTGGFLPVNSLAICTALAPETWSALSRPIGSFVRLASGLKYTWDGTTWNPNYRTVSANSSVVLGDEHIDVDASGGSVTITYNPATATGMPVLVTKIDATNNPVYINNGSSNIDSIITAKTSTRQIGGYKVVDSNGTNLRSAGETLEVLDSTTFIIYRLEQGTTTWTPVKGSAAIAGTEANILTMDAACKALGIGWEVDLSYTLTADTSYTARMDFSKGGVITLGNFNLTLPTDTVVIPPRQQAFNVNGTGRVLGTPKCGTVYPDWFFNNNLFSTSSVTIGTGSQTFTIPAGQNIAVSDLIQIGATSQASDWMQGVVTAYSGTTLTVNVTKTNGSGTFASWKVMLDATNAIQYSVDMSLRSALPNNGIDKYFASGTVTIDYAASGGSMINTSVPFELDYWNCTIYQYANSNYLFHLTEAGNSATRPVMNWRHPAVVAAGNTGGLLYCDSWGGNTFWLNTFSGYASGAVVFDLVNTGTDYQENNHFYGGRWVGGTAGVTACRMSTTGSSSSFARTVFRDIFTTGTFDVVFDIQAAVYNSLFDGIRGNSAASTIFKLAASYSYIGTMIRNVGLEQVTSGGIFMDCSGCSTSQKLPAIDMTNFFFDGSGVNFSVGSSGLTPFSFPGVSIFDADGIVTPAFTAATPYTTITYTTNDIVVRRTGSELFVSGKILLASFTGGSGNVFLSLNNINIGSSAPTQQAGVMYATGATNNPSQTLALNSGANLIIYPYYRTTANGNLSHNVVGDVTTGLTMVFNSVIKL